MLSIRPPLHSFKLWPYLVRGSVSSLRRRSRARLARRNRKKISTLPRSVYRGPPQPAPLRTKTSLIPSASLATSRFFCEEQHRKLSQRLRVESGNCPKTAFRREETDKRIHSLFHVRESTRETRKVAQHRANCGTQDSDCMGQRFIYGGNYFDSPERLRWLPHRLQVCVPVVETSD